MSRTSLNADAFTIIRNALMVRRENVDIPASNTLKSVLEILKKDNYIDNFKEIDDRKQGILRVYLKYIAGKPAIRNISCVSKPGVRIYVKADKVPKVLRGKGLAVISTSKGVVNDEEARNLGLGGEVIAYIW